MAVMFAPKRPGEKRTLEVSFGHLPEIRDYAETLTGTPTVSTTPTGLTIGTISISGEKVLFVVSGGTDGVDHEIEVLVNTSGGSILVEGGILPIRRSCSTTP